MTLKEAELKKIEYLKISIRNRLHKRHPNKYPKVSEPNISEVYEVYTTLALDRIKDLFDKNKPLLKYFNK